MNVAELVAKLSLKVDEGDWKKGGQLIGGLKSTLAAVGLTVAGVKAAVEGLVASTAAYGNAAQKASQRVGMSVGAYQELVQAGDDVQVSIGSMEAGLRFLGRNAYEASKGGKEAAASFRRLGVSLRGEDGKLRSTDALLMDMADRFAAMADGPEKTALAMRVLGRGGTEMIPLLNKGSAGIAAMREEARKLGLVLSDDAVRASVEYTEAVDSLEDALNGLKYTIGSAFMKPSTEVLQQMAAWVAENRQLIATRVQAFVDGLSAALRRLRQLLQPIWAAVKWLAQQTWLWKIALGALAVVLTAQVGLAIQRTVLSIWEMWKALRAVTAVQALGAAASIATGLAWAAGIGLILIAAEELYGWITGDRATLLEEYFGKFDDFMNADLSDRPFVNGIRTLVDLFRSLGEAVEVARKGVEWFRNNLTPVSDKNTAKIAAQMPMFENQGRASAEADAKGLTGWSKFMFMMREGNRFIDERNARASSAAGAGTAINAGPAPGTRTTTVGPVTLGPIQVGPIQGGTPEQLAAEFGRQIDERFRGILNPAYEAAER